MQIEGKEELINIIIDSHSLIKVTHTPNLWFVYKGLVKNTSPLKFALIIYYRTKKGYANFIIYSQITVIKNIISKLDQIKSKQDFFGLLQKFLNKNDSYNNFLKLRVAPNLKFFDINEVKNSIAKRVRGSLYEFSLLKMYKD